MSQHSERKQLIFLKLGNKCNKCRSVDNLEIDHIDPKTKFIRKPLYNMSQEQLDIELTKCQLLCINCYKEKTFSERYKVEHGTASMYTQGCRCLKCREAHRIDGVDYKEHNREEVSLSYKLREINRFRVGR